MQQHTNKRSMKWTIALLALLLAVLLAACGDDTSEQDGTSQTDQATDTEETSGENAPSEDAEDPQSELIEATEEVYGIEAIDGDTILVEGENGEEITVKLASIETPDAVLPDGTEDEYYGFQAKEFSDVRLKQNTVRLERAEVQNDEDGYTLGYIWLDAGEPGYVNFNQMLLEEGLAVVDESNSDGKYLAEFEEAEAVAKEEQKNIWSVEGYVTEDGFDASLVQ